MCFTSLVTQFTSCLHTWKNGSLMKFVLWNVYFRLASYYFLAGENVYFYTHFTPFTLVLPSYLLLYKTAYYTNSSCSFTLRCKHFADSFSVFALEKSCYCWLSLRLSAPCFALWMLLQRSAGSAWIVIMAPKRIQEQPNDGTWETGRVELNGCQTLKAQQHVNKPTKAGQVHF